MLAMAEGESRVDMSVTQPKKRKSLKRELRVKLGMVMSHAPRGLALSILVSKE